MCVYVYFIYIYIYIYIYMKEKYPVPISIQFLRCVWFLSFISLNLILVLMCVIPVVFLIIERGYV